MKVSDIILSEVPPRKPWRLGVVLESSGHDAHYWKLLGPMSDLTRAGRPDEPESADIWTV